MSELSCPDPRLFERIYRGESTEADWELVGQHLEATNCPRCQFELDQATAVEGLEYTRPTVSWPNIEGYHLLGPLAQGGSSTVYWARNQVTGRLVAVKVFGHRRTLTAEQLKQFPREVYHHLQAEGRRVVQLQDYGESNGYYYLVSEYCMGGSMEKLACRTTQSPTRVAHWIWTIAGALIPLHRHHVVHGDLKPNNLLLTVEPAQTPNGDYDLSSISPKYVRLCDFGLVSNPSDSDCRGGTMPYAAPELYSGEAVRPTADVYALGVLMFRWLTGGWHNDRSIWATRLQEANVPDELRSICERCLAESAQDRYADASELRRALTLYRLQQRQDRSTANPDTFPHIYTSPVFAEPVPDSVDLPEWLGLDE
jgi:serine/threonine protein kinase